MSVFLSFTTPDGSFLLSDAATYDDDGVIRKIESKVWRSWRAPVAITTRGHAEAGAAIAVTLTNLADEIGVDAFLANLQSVVDDVADGLGHLVGPDAAQVLIAAYAGGRGQHRAFATDVLQQNFDRPAFEVYVPPSVFAVGPFVDVSTLYANGVPRIAPGESMGSYVRRVGADILEVMRRIPAPWFGRPDGKLFGIGGRAELTTVAAAGARTEILRTWPDVVGEPVRLSRAERRRVARQGVQS